MSLVYQHLNDDAKTAIASAVNGGPAPASDAALRAAWEADHYAHSVLLSTCTDSDCQAGHREAMATIEAALAP